MIKWQTMMGAGLVIFSVWLVGGVQAAAPNSLGAQVGRGQSGHKIGITAPNHSRIGQRSSTGRKTGIVSPNCIRAGQRPSTGRKTGIVSPNCIRAGQRSLTGRKTGIVTPNCIRAGQRLPRAPQR